MSYATLFPVSSAHNGCNLSISSGASACLLQTAVLLLSSEYPYRLKLNSKLSENYSQTCTLSSFSYHVVSMSEGRVSVAVVSCAMAREENSPLIGSLLLFVGSRFFLTLLSRNGAMLSYFTITTIMEVRPTFVNEDVF